MSLCTNTKEGLILPIIPDEYKWNNGFRAFLYVSGMIYCFIGVAIASDIFMDAITVITSETKEKMITDPRTGQKRMIKTRVWNETVANLTLMALGSSAPEILLSVIEIVGSGFMPGDLGPGTIVGSAAFNLFVIIGLCMVFPPKGETRRIVVYRVFVVTSISSIFAYLWMAFVVIVVTPNQIEIWEGLATLLMFPGLVILSWWSDHKFCIKGRHLSRIHSAMSFEGPGDPKTITEAPDEEEGEMYLRNGEINTKAVYEFYKRCKSITDLDDEEIAALVATKLLQCKKHSQLWYKMGATRELIGGAKLAPQLNQKLQQVYTTINEFKKKDGRQSAFQSKPRRVSESLHDKAIVEFQAASFAVPENIGFLTAVILRRGRADNSVNVKVQTMSGTAKAGKAFENFDKIITIEPFVYETTISVKIYDHHDWQPDEDFFVKLSVPEGSKNELTIGTTSVMEVVILNNEEQGKLGFSRRVNVAKETSVTIPIEVVRTGGVDGEITVKWRTLEGKMPPPDHFQVTGGVLTFANGERKKFLDVPVLASGKKPDGADECGFEVELYEGKQNGVLSKARKAIINISSDAQFDDMLNKLMAAASAADDTESMGQIWIGRIQASLSVNGGNDDASTLDYIMHFIAFFWKALLSLIPPPEMLKGWPCFFVSLLIIGVLTAIIGDFASIFGCLVGLNDYVTAITLVALGTSLPDLWASKTAAEQDKYADNSVGNVTGSNSVNVFLGLGLPWTMASIYHSTQSGYFCVPSGAVVFNVLFFSLLAFFAILLILIRRFYRCFGYAELGGPKGTKIYCCVFMLSLWFIYIIISALQAHEHINTSALDGKHSVTDEDFGNLTYCQRNIAETEAKAKDAIKT